MYQDIFDFFYFFLYMLCGNEPWNKPWREQHSGRQCYVHKVVRQLNFLYRFTLTHFPFRSSSHKEVTKTPFIIQDPQYYEFKTIYLFMLHVQVNVLTNLFDWFSTVHQPNVLFSPVVLKANLHACNTSRFLYL